MIRQACYVTCDRCGDPAETTVEGADMARRHARQQGFKRVVTRADVERPDWMDQPSTAMEDVCSRCLKPGDPGVEEQPPYG